MIKSNGTCTLQTDCQSYSCRSRLAEFVSKSIDNLAQDMHVKDGMRYLGLKESVKLSSTISFILIPCSPQVRRIFFQVWRFALSHIKLSALVGKIFDDIERRELDHSSRMLMQEKEATYKGGIMAFVPSRCVFFCFLNFGPKR